MERPKNSEVRRDLNEEEKQAVEQFKETDKKLVENFKYILIMMINIGCIY